MRQMFSLFKSTSRLLLVAAPRKPQWLSYVSHKDTQIKMKIIPVRPAITQTYINKNKDLRRVLSPHLSIYKAEITSMMSITLRMTGLALGIMAWTVFLTKLFSAQNVYFVNLLENLKLNDCYWTSAKTIVVFPFAFHLVAGIRHLMFDTSKLLEKPQFYATGYAAILMAFALAVCLGMMEDICDECDKMQHEKELETENK